MISATAVRAAAGVVCVAGIAGMIVTTIGNHNGAAISFGLATAVAVLCSMVAKAVAADTEQRLGATALRPSEGAQADPEPLAELVERQVRAAVAEGASDATVRQLVGEAVRLGRILGPEASGRESLL